MFIWVNIMANDDLVMQGFKASVVMFMTWVVLPEYWGLNIFLAEKIPNLKLEGHETLYM